LWHGISDFNLPDLSGSAFASAFSNLLGIFSEGDGCLLISRVLFLFLFPFLPPFWIALQFLCGAALWG
jgi:hypothetical protein